jgi:glycosyltransferase involved in cell wall biosynthesis
METHLRRDMTMPYHNTQEADICVVGRFSFGSGIGMLTYSACEMLARSYSICVLPTGAYPSNTVTVSLPNGRELPICRDKSRIKIWFFVDVLWNGVNDFNYCLVPETGARIAYVVFDSDEFPFEWVEILNNRFDLALMLSPHLEPVAIRSGVNIPIGVLPLALDLEPLLSLPGPRKCSTGRVQFLTICAYHPRKELDTLLEAFAQAFETQDSVELVLHSNLAFGDTLDRLKRLAEQLGLTNVSFLHENLSEQAKNNLIANSDVFVNCSRGEGYSIGAREALAAGKPLVLSAVGGHLDLAGCPGVLLIPAHRRVPARYPEIDNRVFGVQFAVEAADLATGLREADTLVRSSQHLATQTMRRRTAARYSFSHSWPSFANIIDTDFYSFRPSAPQPPDVSLPDGFRKKIESVAGRRAAKIGSSTVRVSPMYDGGYYSNFNSFFSHLVWDLRDERVRMTLPDWDVPRLLQRHDSDKFMSFCYGTPEDGNIWLKLYEPLFGLSDIEMEGILTGQNDPTETTYNEHREPLLTYVHAYRLYTSPEFPKWRRQYHSVYRDHVHLRQDLSSEVETFCAERFRRKYMIAAHVRHPSHVIEQPGFHLASVDAYIDEIKKLLFQRDLKPARDDWGLFLATDQDCVVDRFVEAFGEHVCFFEDVRRTSPVEDAAFEKLPNVEKNRLGHQLQHLVSADRSAWSIRMAREIVRDATVMSRCHFLLHVVSNVSTAVSYMNPKLEMKFMN